MKHLDTNLSVGRPKVLIVDDKVENLVALVHLLSDLGVEIIKATSGNEALRLTLEHDFALILLDVQMPEMDGFETAELMRQEKKTEHVPIIFLSAIFSGEVYRIKGVESGAIDFLEKPLQPQVLLGKVRLFLELHAHRNSLVEQSLRQIVEKVSDGVLIVDRDGVIHLANPAAHDLYGVAGGSLVGRPFDFPLQVVKRSVVAFVDEQGKKHDVELAIAPMDWMGNDAFVVSMRDVTELRQMVRELETAVRERDARNVELESFTYTVSHDLKSPLVTIGGFVGLLERELGAGASEDILSFLEIINGAVKKMADLLDHLLDLSRVGRFVTPPSRIPLAELFQDCALQMQKRLDERGVSLRVTEPMPVIEGDRIRLQQVVQNLLENALRYMGNQTEPVIEVGFGSYGGGQALYVRDNGSGISEPYLEKVFGLFERLDSSSEGSGVGLALVRKIVEVHGGRVWVESEGLGRGCTFWLDLPFLENEG